MVTVAELNSGHMPDWCPGCLLPGSLIHKNPSVDKIENVKIGDRVLGSDGRYHQVTEVFVHNHKGKMYAIKSKCLGLTTLTDEHPVLSVKRAHAKLHNTEFELKWTRADQLNKGDYIAFPILKEVEDKEEIALPLVKKAMDRKSKPIPKTAKVDDGFLRLCGYYIAEGYVHDREIIFTFNSKEQELADDVIRLSVSIFGISPSVKLREKKHTIDVSISSSQLARLFSEWFGTGAQNKKIPHFIMLLPKAKQRGLLKGLWMGDGWVGKGRANYRTISRLLAEQLKVLLIRHQIVPTISVNKASGMHKESYSVRVVSRRDMTMLSKALGVSVQLRNQGKPPSSIILEEFVLTPIREISTFDYEGSVHNFEVEGIHSYVGENAVLHNCGDFGILIALKGALAKLDIPPHETVVVAGIGCGSKIPHFVKTYGFEGLHGRSLPPATGIHLANSSLKVIAIGGDGDGYGIGMGHFVHAMRRNLDFTYIVQNNEIYGLTVGQASPTTRKGVKTKSTPNGTIEKEVNPLLIALSAGATFVARGFSGDIPYLTNLIAEGVKHRGIAHIDVFQPCVTWRKDLPYDLYQKKIYKLETEGHDPASFEQAIKRAQEFERWPVGVFFKEEKPIYSDEIPFIREKPLVKHDISDVDVSKFIEEFF